MTTPVETKATATEKPKATKKRKLAKRGYNALGKFFAIVRVELEMTTETWAKSLGVSTLAVANIERGDKPMPFDFATKVTELVAEKAPKYTGELAALIAEQLNVIIIPAEASAEAVESAYLTLHHYDEQVAKANAQTHAVA